ncbi:MAG TPA: Cof-type HAD-IIB family hydrolase, partial [Firmicutes bacterium]|nr:Cof-type HAD-IIB family hydrolase [Bacillota bacterium]
LWAGLGIAMENGSPLLKEKAGLIAPSNDRDGVAFIIEELLR